MRLIQNISSTLRTWVFKKKLLRFSDRYRVEPQACFYCPEMCRFSCPTAETLRHDGTTPRGKMSLLHLAERGFSAESVAGTEAGRLWFLEQCTGCGRCTEYCVYEVDVAANLRHERAAVYDSNPQLTRKAGGVPDLSPLVAELEGLRGIVLLCEPARREWWEARPGLVEKLGVKVVSGPDVLHRQWARGILSGSDTVAIGEALEGCKQIWVESPEAGWFLAHGLKQEAEALDAEIRLVWQAFFADFASRELEPDTVVHESFHLTRLFPRLGYSIPMYERGLMPFHAGWNVWDCGGEGFYRQAHPEHAREMGARFLDDLRKDGRRPRKIVCQSLSCVEHLRALTDVPVSYWLDEVSHG